MEHAVGCRAKQQCKSVTPVAAHYNEVGVTFLGDPMNFAFRPAEYEVLIVFGYGQLVRKFA